MEEGYESGYYSGIDSDDLSESESLPDLIKRNKDDSSSSNENNDNGLWHMVRRKRRPKKQQSAKAMVTVRIHQGTKENHIRIDT